MYEVDLWEEMSNNIYPKVIKDANIIIDDDEKEKEEEEMEVEVESKLGLIVDCQVTLLVSNFFQLFFLSFH